VSYARPRRSCASPCVTQGDRRTRAGPDRFHQFASTQWRAFALPGGETAWLNPIMRRVRLDPPPWEDKCRGGILADEMGLGKTAEIIALVAAGIAGTTPGGVGGAGAVGGEGGSSGALVADELLQATLEDLDCAPGGRAATALEDVAALTSGHRHVDATLVVCPFAVVQVWADEIQRFTNGALPCFVHLDKKRLASADQIRALGHGIVITTFHTLAAEWQRASSRASGGAGEGGATAEPALLSVKWHRVVLDEAHNIRNPNSNIARACCALAARCRWCVTGTPVQNGLQDVQSLLRFLQHWPWSDAAWWGSALGCGEDQHKQRLLQAALHPVTLLRTKRMAGLDGKPLVQLPEAKDEVMHVRMTPAEWDLYQAVYQQLRAEFVALTDSSSKGDALQAFVLVLRLRQLCLNPRLAFPSPGAAGSPPNAGDDTTSSAGVLQQAQRGAAALRARVCDRVDAAIAEQGSKLSKVVELLVAIRDHNRRMATEGRPVGSVALVPGTGMELPPRAKVVVFSFFKGFLHMAAARLLEEGIRCSTYDGDMTRADREGQLGAFRKGETDVLLITLMAGGVGLTLTEASVCLLCDPWWNPAVEEQAWSRVHRMGQQHTVYIRRLIAVPPGFVPPPAPVHDASGLDGERTLEQGICRLQKSKQQHADAAASAAMRLLSGGAERDSRSGVSDNASKLSTSDMRMLFNVPEPGAAGVGGVGHKRKREES